MPGVPWWGVLSSAVAPVVLIGGWTIAADLQPGSFDAVSRSISSLAADGATDRWVMTLALLVVGCCDVITGLSLRPAALRGRLLLILGGCSSLVVAASPQPVGGGASLSHIGGAAVACVAMTLWPLAGRRAEPSAPAGLRPAVTVFVAVAIAGLAVWFGAELIFSGSLLGVSERVLTGVQTTWPLIVVLSVFAAVRRGAAAPAADIAR